MENTHFESQNHSDISCERAELGGGSGLGAANASEAGGLRGARIASVLAQINQSFADQQFSTRVVAENLGLSVRDVQDLLGVDHAESPVGGEEGSDGSPS